MNYMFYGSTNLNTINYDETLFTTKMHLQEICLIIVQPTCQHMNHGMIVLINIPLWNIFFLDFTLGL